MLKRTFFLTHAPINAIFAQNAKDFVVEEIPLYEPSGSGDHLFARIRKKGLSTWDAAQIFSEKIGVKAADIGYAGLKDKNAMTAQTFSFPKKYRSALEKFDDKNIKILEIKEHNNKLKIGHLKGNRFFVRLKKVREIDSQKISAAIDVINKFGAPNFFGFQRFGRDMDNYQKAREFLDGKSKIRGKKMQKFLISALQSANFNNWLSKRIEISHIINNFSPYEAADEIKLDESLITDVKKQSHFFKIIDGDLMCHYPHGKFYFAEDTSAEAARFYAKQTAPTGALCGFRSLFARGAAGEIESEFFEDIPAGGDRRYAWVFPQDLSGEYIAKEAHYELAFYLPKGSYATTLLEELLRSELRAENSDEKNLSKIAK
ncbi:MAG: tRNA pseudouridine(13) synthase TruD [Helicobacteraceae bacterium]|jgi:tRNA pseudouridine13 synthase|nr:tRNA pseudouridine(13) synthase TruD [Helicobacteraceae bacterium]